MIYLDNNGSARTKYGLVIGRCIIYDPSAGIPIVIRVRTYFGLTTVYMIVIVERNGRGREKSVRPHDW